MERLLLAALLPICLSVSAVRPETDPARQVKAISLDADGPRSRVVLSTFSN